MSKLFNSINNFFKAGSWSGAAWLFTLCLMLILLAVGYIIAHNSLDIQGREYVQLDKRQMLTIKKFLDNNPDTSANSDARDKMRIKRTDLIQLYLRGEFDNKITSRQRNELDSLLNQVSNAEVYDYLSDKKLLKQSFFWLTGSNAYIEAWLWCLMGVLASLIYYVSIANTKTLTTAGNDDSGNFDPGEIPGQVAKMFYAPVVTIVIILGYHYLSSGESNMIDITMNTGLILFSFIAGFFSARLMKFLDRLKELILPFSADTPTTTKASKNSNANISVQVKLSDTLASSPDAENIISKFKEAEVTLTSESGGDTITLANTSDDNPDVFSVSKIPNGKYVLKATMAIKKEDATQINLAGQQEIGINEKNNAFTLVLEKTDEADE